jgi:hypothetical protein
MNKYVYYNIINILGTRADNIRVTELGISRFFPPTSWERCSRTVQIVDEMLVLVSERIPECPKTWEVIYKYCTVRNKLNCIVFDHFRISF